MIASKDFHIPPSRNGHLINTVFTSRFVAPRNVTVWLPPEYSEKGEARYPVIYAHDGQNLFDPATAFGGVDWEMDKALARLAAEGVRPAIVVGIWNTTARRQEYFPQRVFENLMSPEEQAASVASYGSPCSDLYLRFIVEELKPFIDAQYFTRPGQQDTFIMGSSMGGLISAYAMCEYPEIFSAAACISTHWIACQGKMVDYLREHLPDPLTHRFYFDHGSKNQDAMYEPFQFWVDNVLRSSNYAGGRRTLLSFIFSKGGYSRGRSFLSEKFRGEGHSELSWRRRVDIPLRFLLANE